MPIFAGALLGLHLCRAQPAAAQHDLPRGGHAAGCNLPQVGGVNAAGCVTGRLRLRYPLASPFHQLTTFFPQSITSSASPAGPHPPPPACSLRCATSCRGPLPLFASFAMSASPSLARFHSYPLCLPLTRSRTALTSTRQHSPPIPNSAAWPCAPQPSPRAAPFIPFKCKNTALPHCMRPRHSSPLHLDSFLQACPFSRPR